MVVENLLLVKKINRKLFKILILDQISIKQKPQKNQSFERFLINFFLLGVGFRPSSTTTTCCCTKFLFKNLLLHIAAAFCTQLLHAACSCCMHYAAAAWTRKMVTILFCTMRVEMQIIGVTRIPEWGGAPLEKNEKNPRIAIRWSKIFYRASRGMGGAPSGVPPPLVTPYDFKH